MGRLYGCPARCAVAKITLRAMIQVEINQMKSKTRKRERTEKGGEPVDKTKLQMDSRTDKE